MAFVITERCKDVLDRGCVSVCPVDCIYEGDDVLYINPAECIDCTACMPVCPVDAIFPEAELPPELQQWAERTRQWFQAQPSPLPATGRR